MSKLFKQIKLIYEFLKFQTYLGESMPTRELPDAYVTKALGEEL